MKKPTWVAGTGLLALLAGLLLASMAPHPSSSMIDGHLTPCPDSPNCVCSQDPRPEHQVDAFPYSGEPAAALARLMEIVRSEPRTRIVDTSPVYLRAEFRSRVFRFVDDVEFLVDPARSVIEVRSASRVGYSDLGVNRRRVEHLRSRFLAANSGPGASSNPSPVIPTAR
jgi:uncharacterized protein (DUF1499 family)